MKWKTKEQYKEINETKSWYFEKISKIDKLLAKQAKVKTQINNIRDGKGDIIIDNRRDYFEILNFNKLENLEQMNKFLDTYNQTKLNQEDINNLKRPIISNEIEIVIQSLPTKKTPGLDGFAGKFY
jgi:hypothetical protein